MRSPECTIFLCICSRNINFFFCPWKRLNLKHCWADIILCLQKNVQICWSEIWVEVYYLCQINETYLNCCLRCFWCEYLIYHIKEHRSIEVDNIIWNLLLTSCIFLFISSSRRTTLIRMFFNMLWISYFYWRFFGLVKCRCIKVN